MGVSATTVNFSRLARVNFSIRILIFVPKVGIFPHMQLAEPFFAGSRFLYAGTKGI